MANEVKIKVTSTADTKGFNDANKSLAETKVSADLAGKSVDSLSENFTESDRKATEAKRSVSNLNDQLRRLDASAEISRAELKRLASALADTDNAAQRIDIRKAISKLQADLNSTTKAKKTLIVDIDVDKKGFLAKFETLGQDAAGLASNHVGATIGAAVGIAAAPVIVGTISTALAAGAGAAGLGAGVALAFKNDPALAQAAKDVGARFMKEIGDGATAAFSGPLHDSLNILSDAGDEVAQHWTDAFSKLGPAIAPLTHDIADSVVRVSDSLSKLAGNSGPALGALGDSVRLVADGVGDFIDIVGDGGPEAAANLTLISGALADMIRDQGKFLAFLNDLSNNPILSGTLIPLLRDHYKDLADSTSGVIQKHESLAEAMEGVKTEAEFERTALSNLAKDMHAETDPVFGLLDAQDKLADAEKNATKAVKEHGRGSKEADSALRGLAEAALDVEGKAGDLAQTTGGHLTPALRATLSAAGLTESQIGDLDRQFGEARRSGNDFAKTYRAKIDASTQTAEQKIRHVRELLDQVHSKKISVNVVVNESRLDKVYNTLNRLGGNYAHGGIKGAASGMATSGLTWVGEQGPELVSLPTGSTVHSSGDSMRMMRQGMDAAGGGTLNLVISREPGAGRDLLDVLIEQLRFRIDRNGQGSAQRYLGRVGVSA